MVTDGLGCHHCHFDAIWPLEAFLAERRQGMYFEVLKTLGEAEVTLSYITLRLGLSREHIQTFSSPLSLTVVLERDTYPQKMS